MYNKQDIVAEARKWLGTNFHHQGRIKKCSTNKGGCDCIGLVIGIIRDLELPSTFKRKNGETIPLYDFDYTNYSAQPSGAKMLELIGQHFTPIDISDAVPGDLMVFRFGSNPQHVGVVGDYVHGGLSIIHTYASANKVVEHHLSKNWLGRAVAAYSFKPEHLGK